MHIQKRSVLSQTILAPGINTHILPPDIFSDSALRVEIKTSIQNSQEELNKKLMGYSTRKRQRKEVV